MIMMNKIIQRMTMATGMRLTMIVIIGFDVISDEITGSVGFSVSGVINNCSGSSELVGVGCAGWVGATSWVGGETVGKTPASTVRLENHGPL